MGTAANGNRLVHLTYDCSLRHPRNLKKPPGFVTKKLSILKSKGQVGATICSAYDNTNDKKYTHRKLNNKQSNENAEKIAIERNVQCANTQ